MPTPYSPTGIIWQTEAVIEWVFLCCKQTKLLTTYVDMVSKLIFKMRTHSTIVGLRSKDYNSTIF